MLGSVLRSSMTGVNAASFAVRTTANNLANVQTDGFRSSRVVFADQKPHHAREGTGQIGSGVEVVAVDTNATPAPIVLSHDPFHLAIQGEGFFALQGADSRRLYSRDGRFRLDGDGQLVAGNGTAVLGYVVDKDFQLNEAALKPIQIPLSRSPAPGARLNGLSVDDSGTIRGQYSDGVSRKLGRIGVASFSNPGGLVHHDHNALEPSATSGLPNFSRRDSTQVVSGAREYSNTDIAQELVNLSRYSTMYRANLAVLTTSEELLDDLFNLRRF